MSRKFVTFFDEKPIQSRRKGGPSLVDAFVGFGSNLGNRRRNIERALRILSQTQGLRIRQISSLYEAESVGGPPQRPHLNGVVRLQTSLTLSALGRRLLLIEKKIGRKRGIHWGPRILDLDVLTFNKDARRSGGFVVPHPRYHLRRFVLVPFCDLAPHNVHPTLKLTNQRLLSGLTLQGQRVTMAARWKNGRFYPFKRKSR
jgi:2-amino-4-hydroxy-6-hydroxymethyldihydropteridine diphosphokinase